MANPKVGALSAAARARLSKKEEIQRAAAAPPGDSAAPSGGEEALPAELQMQMQTETVSLHELGSRLSAADIDAHGRSKLLAFPSLALQVGREPSDALTASYELWSSLRDMVEKPPKGNGRPRIITAALAKSSSSSSSSSSLIVAPSRQKEDNSLLVAFYNGKAVSVFELTPGAAGEDSLLDISSGRKIAEVPMASTPLLFWHFVSASVLVLITNLAGFTLRLSSTAASEGPQSPLPLSPKPVKILDRIDVAAGSR